MQRLYECIVGCHCRFCADRNLGLYAIRLAAAAALGQDDHRTRRWR
jgi:hypothetical protein